MVHIRREDEQENDLIDLLDGAFTPTVLLKGWGTGTEPGKELAETF
jgi:hypothetical protein